MYNSHDTIQKVSSAGFIVKMSLTHVWSNVQIPIVNIMFDGVYLFNTIYLLYDVINKRFIFMFTKNNHKIGVKNYT